MQPTLCSRCKKNVAVVFISKMEGDKTTNEGLCLKCAKELGLPQVDDMMKRMGISDEDLDTLNNEMLQAMSGVENIEDLPGGEDAGEEEEEGKTATFPFLNRLFSGEAGQLLPEEAGYPLMLLSCVISLAAIAIAAFVGGALSYYLLYAMVAWLFALLVYYTVKMM